MASNSTTDLHPVLNAAYQRAKMAWIAAHPLGPNVILTCTYRSGDEQNRLYEQGRTTKGPKVTNAKSGESPHNFYPARAFDIGFINDKKMDWSDHLFIEFATILLSQTKGITWGGNFKSLLDQPHFELTVWRGMKSSQL